MRNEWDEDMVSSDDFDENEWGGDVLCCYDFVVVCWLLCFFCEKFLSCYTAIIWVYKTSVN